MRAIFEKITSGDEESISVRKIDQYRFDAPWHFHPEHELTYIISGKGDRFVGDSIESYAAGDLILLGSELPHVWKSQPSNRAKSKAIVVHFSQDFPVGPVEFSDIKRTLELAGRGLCYSADSSLCARIGRMMIRLPKERKLKRLLVFLEILDELANAAPTAKRLSSQGQVQKTDQKAAQRINRAYEYIYSHLPDEITLDAVSNAAGMSPAGFSRYFKRMTGRNLSNLIGELRVGQACKRLQESNLGIAEIAYEVGFGSLSNFNRLFKQLKGKSPREWRARLGDD